MIPGTDLVDTCLFGNSQNIRSFPDLEGGPGIHHVLVQFGLR
jgi:hypothetical protein